MAHIHSIQAIKFKTSNPDKYSLLIGSTEEKIENNSAKGIIICLDSSGSMGAEFNDPDTVLVHDDIPNPYGLMSSFTQVAGPMSSFTPGPMSFAPGPMSFAPGPVAGPVSSFTPAFANSLDADTSSSFGTPMPSLLFPSRNTRLSCEDSFMGKMIDLFDFLEKTQNIRIPLSVIVFGTQVKVITNLDGMAFQTMKQKVSKALTQGGGTNYELAIEETLKLIPRYSGDVTTIFLSDGGHCDGTLSKDQLLAKYPKIFKYCIGIGEGGSDYDETTLQTLGEEFIRGTTPQRIRDTVANISLGIATMRAKNIRVTGNGLLVSNMEKRDGQYRQKEMSMLMEMYFSIEATSEITIRYEKGDGVEMEIRVSPETHTNEDCEFGDKILHTMELLEKITNVADTMKDMTPKDKIQYLNKIKQDVSDEPITQKCLGTRIHNYYLTVIRSLDKMILTKDERRLKDLTQNVRSDVYNAVCSAGADNFCSPMSQAGPISQTPPCQKNKITNSKCNICCTNDREVVFEPCGHFLSCTSCSLLDTIRKGGCPYCRGAVEGVILVDLADNQKGDDWDMVCQTCHREHVNCISKDCKHIFSCEKCIMKQIRSKKEVECTVCSKKCTKYTEVHI
jgi:hypothetical protein